MLAVYAFRLRRECGQLFAANDGLATRTKEKWEKYWAEEYRKREHGARFNAVEEYKQLVRSRSPATTEGKDAELYRLKRELEIANKRTLSEASAEGKNIEISNLRRELIGARNELYEFQRKTKQEIASDLKIQERNDRFKWQQEQSDRANAVLTQSNR